MADWASVTIAGSRVQDKAMSVRTADASYASLAAGAWRTELNISGSGYLHAISWRGQTQTYPIGIRITIDGGTPLRIDDSSGSLMEIVFTGCVGEVFAGVRFKTSLLVEALNGHTASQNMATSVTYSLT